MGQNPKPVIPRDFGIITVARNNLAGLVRTLDSVFDQSAPVRLHVVDGGSTDGSLGYLLSRKGVAGFSFSSGPDCGPYDAMNRGIDAIDVQRILFLNSGDRLNHPGVVGQLRELLPGLSAPLVCCGVQLVDPDGLPSPGREPSKDLALLERYNIVYHQGALIQRSLLQQSSGYDTTFRYCADYDFFLNCQRRGVEFHWLPLTLSTFVRDGLTSSPRHALGYYLEMLRVQRHHGLTPNYSLLAIGAGKALLGRMAGDKLRAIWARAVRS